MSLEPEDIPFVNDLVDTPETRPYWDACNEGRLLLTRCRDTGRVFAYPRGVSPFTLSGNVEWFEASGRGRVYACSVVSHAKGPYVIAYVTLEEGVTVLTGLVGAGAEPPRIGQAVKVVFRETASGQKVPFFTPA